MTPVRWLIDASNVIGARPDGWWRDRDAAARRLVDAVREWAANNGEDATVVLDAGPDGLLGEAGGVAVIRARRRGRDAADDEIVALLGAAAEPARLRVVTSDAALADRARSLGAQVEGAGAFRGRLNH